MNNDKNRDHLQVLLKELLDFVKPKEKDRRDKIIKDISKVMASNFIKNMDKKDFENGLF